MGCREGTAPMWWVAAWRFRLMQLAAVLCGQRTTAKHRRLHNHAGTPPHGRLRFAGLTIPIAAAVSADAPDRALSHLYAA